MLDGVAETVLAQLQGTLRPLADILALLTRAGFTRPDALHGWVNMRRRPEPGTGGP